MGMLDSFPPGGAAVLFGASGAIGGAMLAHLEESGAFTHVLAFSRQGPLGAELQSEPSIIEASRHAGRLGAPLRVVVVATGVLHDVDMAPEKSWRDIDPKRMARAFAINAIGPVLIMKHFLPLLPREGKSVFAALSARVGSIGDNRLGGWHSYRASKAALNQLVRTAAVELKRRRPEAICVALHPGTVESPLSAPFSKSGLHVREAKQAARDVLAVIDGLGSAASGGFFDYRGEPIPW